MYTKVRLILGALSFSFLLSGCVVADRYQLAQLWNMGFSDQEATYLAETAGLTSSDLQVFLQAGLSPTQTYKLVSEHGVGADDIRQLEQKGISGSALFNLLDTGISLADSRRWIAAFETNGRMGVLIRDMITYVRLDLEPHQAVNWHVELDGKPEDLKAFMSNEVSYEQAVQWRENGFVYARDTSGSGRSSPSASYWVKNGVGPQDAAKYHAAGKSLRGIGLYHENRVKLSELGVDWERWLELRSRPMSEVTVFELLEMGIPNSEIDGWAEIEAPAHAGKYIYQWYEKGIPVNEARDWLAWSNWHNAGYSFALEAYDLCDSAPPLEGIFSENPYDVEGHCYFMGAQIAQLLSADQALVKSWGGSQMVKVNFKTGRPGGEGSRANGLVVGRGAFRYQDISGSSRIVPEVDMILRR